MADKIALVTGGTRGIGLGIAECLAKDGFQLALCGVRPESDVQEAISQLRCVGTKVVYCRGDISNRREREGLLSKAKEAFGTVHTLVNNAGIAPRARRDILEATEESFDEVLGINLKGPYFLTQAVARWMIDSSRQDPKPFRCIVNVSSVSAIVASDDRGEYCISKAGVSMATKLWAVRLAEHGISVFEVQPGVIDTDMTSKVKDKYDRLISEGLLLQARWGMPRDIGKTVAALARGDLPYSTGATILADGGMTIRRL